MKHINNYFFTNFSGNYEFVYLNTVLTEVCVTSYTTFIQLLVIFVFLSVFVSIFFNFYGNSNTEDSTIDSDYVIMSSLVEAEKELTSIDDLINLALIIIFIFGIYVYIYSLIIINTLITLSIVYFSLVLVFFFILGMPTMLLYDFGIYFLVYLKGSGKSDNILVESIFDYLACTVYYSRMLAQ